MRDNSYNFMFDMIMFDILYRTDYFRPIGQTTKKEIR